MNMRNHKNHAQSNKDYAQFLHPATFLHTTQYKNCNVVASNTSHREIYNLISYK